MRFQLEKGFLAVEGDVNEKILVRQDPLQSRGEFLVVIHHQNGFQLESVDVGLNLVWLGLKFLCHAALVKQSRCQSRQKFAPANPSFGGSHVRDQSSSSASNELITNNHL